MIFLLKKCRPPVVKTKPNWQILIVSRDLLVSTLESVGSYMGTYEDIFRVFVALNMLTHPVGENDGEVIFQDWHSHALAISQCMAVYEF